ncbi:MAG: plastocyanin/azurin family copper-binding protein [Candidatus Nanohaloarchaeota archaeon QJJ-5]|nr:plastocyanin/azurin family copper-binding protein [Candidatus Nanohaloarchaeota archaeon QJJ-5]
MNKKIVVFLLMATIVAGCLHGGSTPDATNEDQNPNATTPDANTTDNEDIREITVESGNYFFDPSEIDVEAGETVRFIIENEGGTHDLVLEDSDGNDVASTDRVSNPGETDSFTYTFDRAQDFQIYCSVGNHRQQGMEGDVNVYEE